MNYQNILKHEPRFKLINFYNITNRLQDISNKDLFIVYDLIKGTYELHSVKSYMLTGFSHNATLDKELLNGYIINDFKANNLNKFALDIKDRNEKLNYLYDTMKNRTDKTSDMLRLVEKVVGTKI
jgi:hypothetical protein